ncbi:MAG: MBL fold metallo-hydrolase [Candidatus Electrothrix scaldis]|nr:MAG: MBL fold metallo-hydrolase [Candidatus Electrothrix sp. GW3-3]
MKLHTIDLLFQDTPGLISSYLLEGAGSLALIEPGPASTTDQLVEAIDKLGYSPSDVKDVMVSHIHLDHAGAVGWWARQGARIHVHYVGAPHLIDPSKLIASATRIYQDKMEALWGEILPVPESQVCPLYDDDRIRTADTEITVIDAPGHARHHVIYKWGTKAFTGDACGVRLSGKSYINLPAPPPEFNPVDWHSLLTRLRSENLEALYLTHFGEVTEVASHLDALDALIDQACSFFQELMQESNSKEDITEKYLAWVQEQGQAMGLKKEEVQEYEIINPSAMSVVGIMRYLSQR